MKDPLDLFGDLPDFPGSRQPKNRSDKKPTYLEAEDRYNGAKAKTYTINGEKKTFFTVGGLAKALRRKPGTIRMWEFNGWLPKAMYRTPAPSGEHFGNKSAKGRRLYSLEQVEFLLTAVERFSLDSSDPNWEAFKTHIKQNYPR
jgi:hypothetical protein